jgi:hypothetical protein
VTLRLTFEGGVAPFVYTVKWGHGDPEVGSQALPGAIELEHTFPDSRPHQILVILVDGQNHSESCEEDYYPDSPTGPGG